MHVRNRNSDSEQDYWGLPLWFFVDAILSYSSITGMERSPLGTVQQYFCGLLPMGGKSKCVVLNLVQSVVLFLLLYIFPWIVFLRFLRCRAVFLGLKIADVGFFGVFPRVVLLLKKKGFDINAGFVLAASDLWFVTVVIRPTPPLYLFFSWRLNPGLSSPLLPENVLRLQARTQASGVADASTTGGPLS